MRKDNTLDRGTQLGQDLKQIILDSYRAQNPTKKSQKIMEALEKAGRYEDEIVIIH